MRNLEEKQIYKFKNGNSQIFDKLVEFEIKTCKL